MASGQQKAKENIILFKSWMASMNDNAYKQIVYRGQLSRSEIAKATGFAKSALRQNPAINLLLVELENDLRKRGVLPVLSQPSDTLTKHDQEAVKRPLQANRLSALEKENVELKARIAALEKELSRYKELGETIIELGLLPNA